MIAVQARTTGHIEGAAQKCFVIEQGCWSVCLRGHDVVL